jgi:hypothetical protein
MFEMTAPMGFYIDVLLVAIFAVISLSKGMKVHAMAFAVLTFIDWGILSKFDLQGRSWAAIWGSCWLAYFLYLWLFNKEWLALRSTIALCAAFVLMSPVLYYAYTFTWIEAIWSLYEYHDNNFYNIWYSIIAIHAVILIRGHDEGDNLSGDRSNSILSRGRAILIRITRAISKGKRK